ncbi:hypothetical protein [Cereibacter changlensis]|nr:hypothetical protein [Cereibacter changlensis]
MSEHLPLTRDRIVEYAVAPPRPEPRSCTCTHAALRMAPDRRSRCPWTPPHRPKHGRCSVCETLGRVSDGLRCQLRPLAGHVPPAAGCVRVIRTASRPRPSAPAVRGLRRAWRPPGRGPR